jgi:DNA-3-methyladenine glycosylase
VAKDLSLKRLPHSFYSRSTLEVAGNLLGMYLIRKQGRKRWIGRIVEVEAYIGEDDPACHAFHGLTPRTRIMYGPAGCAYVYFTYGMHFMLNVVTEQQHFPAAILIRALEPVSGFSGADPRPASGPGKLCKSMNIDLSLNGTSLQQKALWIGMNPRDRSIREVRWSKRIGIRVGTEKLWRAYLLDNPFVSGPRFRAASTTKALG